MLGIKGLTMKGFIAISSQCLFVSIGLIAILTSSPSLALAQNNLELLKELDEELPASRDNSDLLGKLDKEMTSGSSPDTLDLLDELDKEMASDSGSSPDTLDLLDELDHELKPDSGQDSLDLLQELDKAKSVSVEPDEESRFSGLMGQMGENLTGSLRMMVTHFTQEVDPARTDLDRKSTFLETLLTLSSRIGGDQWRLNLEGWLEAGTRDKTWQGLPHWLQDVDPERRYFEMNEVYFSIFLDNADLTIGKKIFSNGVATLFSPMDRYNIRESVDLLNSKEYGIWQIQGDYYWQDSTLTATILPVFQPSKGPLLNSRWLAKTATVSFPGAGSSGAPNIKKENPEIDIDNFSYMLKGKTVTNGWDLYTSFYYGNNVFYVQKTDQAFNVTQVIVDIYNVAAGFSTTVKEWEFHGEVLYNDTIDSKDDDYVKMSVGFNYKNDDWAKEIYLDKIELIMEYGDEWLVKVQKADQFIESSEGSRFGQNDLVSRLILRIDDDFNIQVGNGIRIGEKGYYLRLQGEYKVNEDILATLAYDDYSGESGGFYGNLDLVDNVSATIKYSF